MQTIVLKELQRTIPDDEKRCTKCQDVKPFEAFAVEAGRHDGRHVWCKDCRRVYNEKVDWSESYQRRKAKFGGYDKRYKETFQAATKRHHERNRQIARQAREKACADCGKRFPWHVMDFDHVSGEKTSSVSDLIYSAGPARLLREIEKCEVVCANCHRLRTQGRAEGFIENPCYRTKRSRQRLLFLRSIKEGEVCEDCKKAFPPCVLDFDHVRGEKLFSIGTATARSLSSLMEELQKCEIVCANCHRVRTFVRRTGLKE